MNVNSLIRRLSSVEERIEALTETKGKYRSRIEAGMLATGSNKVETIYGYTQLKNNSSYDYSEHPEVAEAEKALAQAKLALKLAQEKAQAKGAPKTVNKVFVFTRNKAVSARAKRSRIYISTIVRKEPSKSFSKVGKVDKG